MMQPVIINNQLTHFSYQKYHIENTYDMKCLTLKHLETQGCVVSTVATDGLMLKHQAISIHNAD